MATDDDKTAGPPEDRTVKELIDAATRADLERWFGLPSFAEVEEKEKQAVRPEDPALVAAREQFERATAAVEPWMLEGHARRLAKYEEHSFEQKIDSHVDPTVARLDLRMVEKVSSMSEPAEKYIPDDVRDDMKECTPQALLRDLHRSESQFDKLFEVTDYGEAHRFDIVAHVDETMSLSWRLPPLRTGSTMTEAANVLRESQHYRRTTPWANLETTNRRRE